MNQFQCLLNIANKKLEKKEKEIKARKINTGEKETIYYYTV